MSCRDCQILYEINWDRDSAYVKPCHYHSHERIEALERVLVEARLVLRDVELIKKIDKVLEHVSSR